MWGGIMATSWDDDLLQETFEGSVQSLFDKVINCNVFSDLAEEYKEDDRIIKLAKVAISNAAAGAMCQRIIEMAQEIVDRLQE
jgi:hypothetical protein